jgi:hypothetical protein
VPDQHETDDGGQKNPDDGDDHRVEQTYEECPQIGAVIGVGNKCLADIKPGAFTEKTETGGNSRPGKVVNGVAYATPHHRANRNDQQALNTRPRALGSFIIDTRPESSASAETPS